MSESISGDSTYGQKSASLFITFQSASLFINRVCSQLSRTGWSSSYWVVLDLSRSLKLLRHLGDFVHVKGVPVGVLFFFYRTERLFEATLRVGGPHNKARSVRLLMTT